MFTHFASFYKSKIESLDGGGLTRLCRGKGGIGMLKATELGSNLCRQVETKECTPKDLSAIMTLSVHQGVLHLPQTSSVD